MSDLTQAQVFDQYVQPEPEKKQALQGHDRKPQNFDEMVVMYMDMLINHRMMETRLHKAEEKIEELVFELNDLKISVIDNNNSKH